MERFTREDMIEFARAGGSSTTDEEATRRVVGEALEQWISDRQHRDLPVGVPTGVDVTDKALRAGLRTYHSMSPTDPDDHVEALREAITAALQASPNQPNVKAKLLNLARAARTYFREFGYESPEYSEVSDMRNALIAVFGERVRKTDTKSPNYSDFDKIYNKNVEIEYIAVAMEDLLVQLGIGTDPGDEAGPTIEYARVLARAAVRGLRDAGAPVLVKVKFAGITSGNTAGFSMTTDQEYTDDKGRTGIVIDRGQLKDIATDEVIAYIDDEGNKIRYELPDDAGNVIVTFDRVFIQPVVD